MKSESVELFPILVKKYTDILTENQINDIFEYSLKHQNLFAPNSEFNYQTDALSSYENRSILTILKENLSSCKNIYEQFQEAVDDYANSVGHTDVKIFNSWINIQQKNSILNMHHHGDTYYAGAFYLNTDFNSSPIFFEDYLNHKTNWNPSQLKENNKYNCNTIFFKPKIGDLLIFPGLLRHGSNGTRNQTDNRMVLSFNAS